MKSTTQVTVTLPTEVVRQLDSAAQREGRTRSNYLRRALQMRTLKNPLSFLPEIQRRKLAAIKGGDHVTHATLHAIELGMLEFRQHMRLAVEANADSDCEAFHLLRQFLSGAEEVQIPVTAESGDEP